MRMKPLQIIERYIEQATVANVCGKTIVANLPVTDIVDVVSKLYREHGLPLKLITAIDEREANGFFRIIYLFGLPTEQMFLAVSIQVQDEFPSITPVIHSASNYERKIMTFFGLQPIGHPDPRTIILHENWPTAVFPLRKDFAWNSRPPIADGSFRFNELEGEGIYQIPVGPVHAGIIEPGHFRFSVAGEDILLLEARLGYSHKGSEKLFETLPLAEKLLLAERISGDSSVSHALAFVQAVEALGNVTVSEQAGYLRVILAELERIANHIGDIGAIMGDTGFNFGGAHCARLRETVLQTNEKITGSRFLRGTIQIGGANVNLTHETKQDMLLWLDTLQADFDQIIAIAEKSNSLLNRLKTTGTLSRQIALDHGVVGVAGRAVGFRMDARTDFPYDGYSKLETPIAVEEGGDVYARYRVRVKEIATSVSLIKTALAVLLPEEREQLPAQVTLTPNSYAVGIVEGWRGDIVYLVATDKQGNISRVAVRDPSFLNWSAIGYACQGNIVPDFPLINKSFNLSYSGNDL